MTFSTLDYLAGIVGQWVGRLLDIMIGALVTGLLIIVFSQFIDRNFVTFWRDSPEEYVKIGLIWLCFMGIVRAFATGDYIRVSLVQDSLPRKIVLVIETLLDILLLALLAMLAPKCWLMLQTARYQIILGTDFSLAVPASGVLVGVVLLIPLIAWRSVRRLVTGHAERRS